MAERNRRRKPAVHLAEVIELLAAAVDGIDGYECEYGDLRYWDARKIDRARWLLDRLGKTAVTDDLG